jgi:hypothetical protein
MSTAQRALVICAVGAIALGAIALRPNRIETKNATNRRGKLTVSAEANISRNESQGVHTEELTAVGIARRQAAAERMQRNLQSKGIDVQVTLEGKDKNEIRFEYIRFSRPLIFRIQNETELLWNLQRDGFKKAVFTDGQLHTWKYDLDNSIAGNQ